MLAAVLSAVITWAIRPLLLRIALAKPNARSSHRIPTPQGAGIAVIAATLLVAAVIAVCAAGGPEDPARGFRGHAVHRHRRFRRRRQIHRGAAAAAAAGARGRAPCVFTAPDDLRIVPACPLWIERGLLLLAGLWFVNLVNFMDGLDWMTVAEVVPVTAAMVCSAGLANPASTTLVAAALCGAMLGFAPFNRPVAKIFLGDVGSLPIGLLLGWCLLQLPPSAIRAALLLPLYYLTDATVTLLRRLASASRSGGASLAFLSARDRQWLYGVARGRRGVRAQLAALRSDRSSPIDRGQDRASVAGGVATLVVMSVRAGSRRAAAAFQHESPAGRPRADCRTGSAPIRRRHPCDRE